MEDGRLRLPQSLGELRGGPRGALMGAGGGAGFGLLSPTGGVVESDRPVLR